MRRGVIVGVVASLWVTGLAIYGFGTRRVGHGSSTAPPPDSRRAGQSEVAELRKQIGRLERQVSTLQGQSAFAPAEATNDEEDAPPEERSEVVPQPPPSAEEIRVAEREYAANVAAIVETQIEREASDPAWSP